jgi:hypothetical protein
MSKLSGSEGEEEMDGDEDNGSETQLQLNHKRRTEPADGAIKHENGHGRSLKRQRSHQIPEPPKLL